MSTQQRLKRLERLVASVAFEVPIQNATGNIPKPLMAKAVHIRNEICEAFDVSLTQLLSRMRPDRICRARFAITLEELAGFAGKTCHGTAMHQLSMGKRMMEPDVDPHFYQLVTEIRRKISVDSINVK